MEAGLGGHENEGAEDAERRPAAGSLRGGSDRVLWCTSSLVGLEGQLRRSLRGVLAGHDDAPPLLRSVPRWARVGRVQRGGSAFARSRQEPENKQTVHVRRSGKRRAKRRHLRDRELRGTVF